MTPAYTLGHISSGHLNPAVSSGLLPGGRFDGKELSPYWVVQVAGVIAAADVLYFVMSGAAGFEGVGGFASNGYGEASPQG
jgi:aquaporin Z